MYVRSDLAERLDKQELVVRMRCIAYVYYFGLDCEIVVVLQRNFWQYLFWLCGVWQNLSC